MKRRRFLQTLGAVIAAPIIPKISFPISEEVKESFFEIVAYTGYNPPIPQLGLRPEFALFKKNGKWTKVALNETRSL